MPKEKQKIYEVRMTQETKETIKAKDRAQAIQKFEDKEFQHQPDPIYEIEEK